MIQRAAAAVYSPEGKQQTQQLVAYYLNNARLIREGLQKAGYRVWGASTLRTSGSRRRRHELVQFFDYLLETLGIVGTPGCGFGPSGEGYFRLTGFGSTELTKQAVERIINGKI